MSVAGALLVGFSIGHAVGSSDDLKQNDVATSGEHAAPTAGPDNGGDEATVMDETPELVLDTTPVRAKDWKIEIKIRQQQCFGSAGCNVTYQINPKYVGLASFNGRRFEVTYEVRGGESGPVINMFTIDEEGTASYASEENVSTPPNPDLSAHVTSVEELTY